MKNYRGLFLAPPNHTHRNLARSIRSVCPDLEVIEEVEQLRSAIVRKPHVIIVATEHAHREDPYWQTFMKLSGSGMEHRCLLLADIKDRERILELLEAGLCHHVIAVSPPGLYQRVTVALAKVLTGDLFGIDKILPWGIGIQEYSLRSSEEKNDILRRLAEYTYSMDIPSRLATLAHTVADEFLMNALFDAPVDEAGTPLFFDKARTDTVTYPGSHRATFRFCCDGRALYLSIHDTFGSLSPESIPKNLVRTIRGGEDQVRQHGQGAGIGLYMVFTSLSDWTINLSPGKRTEMIGVIQADGTYREHIDMPKTFNLFVTP